MDVIHLLFKHLFRDQTDGMPGRLPEVTAGGQEVEPFDNFVRHSQDFHRVHCAAEYDPAQGVVPCVPLPDNPP